MDIENKMLKANPSLGITLEIDGDVTRLNKALSSVNTSIKYRIGGRQTLKC